MPEMPIAEWSEFSEVRTLSILTISKCPISSHKISNNLFALTLICTFNMEFYADYGV